MADRTYRIGPVLPIGAPDGGTHDGADVVIETACPLCAAPLDDEGVCSRRCIERRVERFDGDR